MSVARVSLLRAREHARVAGGPRSQAHRRQTLPVHLGRMWSPLFFSSSTPAPRGLALDVRRSSASCALAPRLQEFESPSKAESKCPHHQTRFVLRLFFSSKVFNLASLSLSSILLPINQCRPGEGLVSTRSAPRSRVPFLNRLAFKMADSCRCYHRLNAPSR